MKPVHLLLIVTALGLILVPSSASAGSRVQRGDVVVVAPRGTVVITSPSSVVVRPGRKIFVVSTPSVFPTVVHPHHFFVPRFRAFAVVTRPVFPFVVSAPPAIVSPPPVVYAQPAPVVSLAPPPLPTPTVIEYPTGWYQLRGDGVTTPYVWVWIPKPPPPPPVPETPPTVPPAPPSDAPADPPSQQRPSASHTELYLWTDELGVPHWTNRLDNIPERYRFQAPRRS